MTDITPFLNVVRMTHMALLDNYNCRFDLNKWDRIDRLLSHFCGCDDYKAIEEQYIIVGRFEKYSGTYIKYIKTPRGYLYNTHRSFPLQGGFGTVSPWCGMLYDSIEELLPFALDDIIRSAPDNIKSEVILKCEKLLPKKIEQMELAL